MGDLIRITDYRQRKRVQNAERLGSKIKRWGGVTILVGILGSVAYFTGYGVLQSFAPKKEYHAVSQRRVVETAHLPLGGRSDELTKYLVEDGIESVRTFQWGHTITYSDTDGDLNVDRIVIDCSDQVISPLERQLEYGTGLLKTKRKKNFVPFK